MKKQTIKSVSFTANPLSTCTTLCCGAKVEIVRGEDETYHYKCAKCHRKVKKLGHFARIIFFNPISRPKSGGLKN